MSCKAKFTEHVNDMGNTGVEYWTSFDVLF
jgi:hypothetical protein